jgi:anhydro-N-acetylmuramic acid kinase
MSLYIGLMSGTSMDGIDAALIHSETNQLIKGITVPYTNTLQSQLREFDASKKHTPQSLLELHHHVGQAFSHTALTLLKETHYRPKDIIAIGSHGQTLYHNPDAKIPTTLQLGCPHTIANNTGITVVADFRTRDLILGGQGAPLAPFYHHELFKNQDLPLAVVNIGGIANVTILDKNNPPVGYDTGPGNVLIDAWIRKHQNLTYDKNGTWAQSGQLIPSCLEHLLADPFFKKSQPKSIDKAYYTEAWLNNLHITSADKPEDIQATLMHLTAHSIADAIKREQIDIKQVLLCGGGAHNKALIQTLQAYLPNHQIHTTNQLNINPDYLEAMMFAWLAEQTIHKKAIDLTSITGSSKPTILGAVYF